MIRWPWSFRDDLVIQLRSALALADAQLVASHERYAVLLDRYHELRVAGANPKEALVRTPPPKPDPIVQAIIAKAGSHLLMRQYYNDYVAEERAKGTDDSVIAKAILDGVDASEIGLPA